MNKNKKNAHDEETTHSENTKKEGDLFPNRRKFMKRLGGATMASAAISVVGLDPLLRGSTASAAESNAQGQSQGGGNSRRNEAARIRIEAAQSNRQATPPNLQHPNNGDETLYPNKIASYSKGLPHNSIGEVDLNAYNAMLAALNSGDPALFEAIPLGGNRKLVNPQAGLAFDMEGRDAHSLVQPPAPTFASRETASEMAENYWMALLRDVPFTEYSSNAIAAAAAADLTAYGSHFKGAKTNVGSGQNNGVVTPDLLFRGLTPGDKAGPYMSQFWYLPCFFGANEVSQRIRTAQTIAAGGTDYMTDFNTWLDVQRGVNQGSVIFDPTPRYMRNGRDIGEWVHVDVLFQGYFQAFLVMAGFLGVPFDSGNPYSGSVTQEGFGTFGGPHIATLLCEVATRALKAVWFQKWYVHRRLRPEVFGARTHRVLYNGATYPVHTQLLNSINSSSGLGAYMPAGNALLPMAFPEGSPLHPAYGAGHGTVAGACVTILKAWFDESAVIPSPVVSDPTGTSLSPYTGPDTLTVGGELNKIASNVAIGRDIAGVHWRSDATESLKLGEAVAISILRDQKETYNEDFSGFSLTKFNGATIII
jgi:hypothetical protein